MTPSQSLSMTESMEYHHETDNDPNEHSSSAANNHNRPEFTLFAGFNQAITAVTVCSSGSISPCFGGGGGGGGSGNNATTSSSGENNHQNDNDDIDPVFTTGEFSSAANRQAQKALCVLARQMTVSKAIVEDVEVLSMLLDRLFS